MQIFFSILYVLAGLLLAIPYCLLAGWNAESYLMVAFVAPAFLFVWFMMAIFVGIIEPGNSRVIHFNWRAAFGKSDYQRFPGFLAFFWAWTLYSVLPIIFHWSAMFIEQVGYETVSSLIDTHRYASTSYAIMGTIMLFVLGMMVARSYEAMKTVWTRMVHR